MTTTFDTHHDDAHHDEVVGQVHGFNLAVVGLDGENLAVQFFYRTADAHGRVGGGLGKGNGRYGCDQERRDGTIHGGHLQW